MSAKWIQRAPKEPREAMESVAAILNKELKGYLAGNSPPTRRQATAPPVNRHQQLFYAGELRSPETS